ncbi:MAG: alpha/beta hydrolase [Solirubrobacterales bacterium]
MSRWLKITLGVVGGIVVLLLLNALVVSNATKSAYVRDDGARLVDTSSGTLQVLDQGSPQGSPIVLLHCETCSMDWWDNLAPLLEPSHRVIRIDLLGMGGSDKPGSGYSIEDQASAVAEALAKLHVVGATVVGHSLGASVAVAVAEQSPQLASRIAIIDQSPEDGFEHESLGEHLSMWPVIGQAIARLVQVAPTSTIRGEYDRAFAPGYNISSGFDNPDQPVDDLRAMTYTALKDTSDAEKDFVAEQPLDQRLAAAHVPLLVIFGAEDQIYDPQAAIARYRDVPGAETHLIPGAGHSPNVEKPDLVAPLILAFAAPAPAAKQPAPKKKAQKKKRRPAKRARK